MKLESLKLKIEYMVKYMYVPVLDVWKRSKNQNKWVVIFCKTYLIVTETINI